MQIQEGLRKWASFQLHDGEWVEKRKRIQGYHQIIVDFCSNLAPEHLVGASSVIIPALN